MTEAEWLAGADLYGMLRLMHNSGRMRKLRLFAVACGRRLKALPSVKRALAAIDLAERYADGLVAKEEMDAASEAAYNATRWTRGAVRTANAVAGWASLSFADVNSLYGLAHALRGDEEALGGPARAVQVELVREVFGNPFRAVTVNPAWLAPTVMSLATTAYEERDLPSGHLDPARLSVLADALEEAGCSEPELLGHLRSPGPHVRGCWALDLILGKA
jgi:hypothetical protein